MKHLTSNEETVGSNPTRASKYAEIAQLVERRIEAPGVAGSTPALGTIYAYLAQSGLEHPTLNRGVAGSNPPMGTIYPRSSEE